jgi:hypothetical protein
MWMIFCAQTAFRKMPYHRKVCACAKVNGTDRIERQADAQHTKYQGAFGARGLEERFSYRTQAKSIRHAGYIGGQVQNKLS